MSFLGLGVDFTTGQQQGLIEDRGSLMLHEVAISCTCRVEDIYAGFKDDGVDRRREPFCPRCGGEGWLYRDPKIVKGLATSIRQQRNILDSGWAQPGDMLFSPSIVSSDCGPPRKIGAFDKLTATWEQPLDDGSVLVRGAGALDDNLALKTGLDPNEDRLWYEPLTAVWCEDENGITYSQDSDFILGPGRVIKWVGKSPQLRQRYTIKYMAFFEWIVFVPPQERRDRDNRDLGQLVFLRKRHIVYPNSNPMVTPADRETLQARSQC